jgi:hypothetical protein
MKYDNLSIRFPEPYWQPEADEQTQKFPKNENQSPINRLVGDMPKVGIRPTIDGRLGGVRESLERPR